MTARRLALLAAILLLGAAGAFAADQPGQKFSISVNDLPKPYATAGVANPSRNIARPDGLLPQVPAGFKIGVYATGLHEPRWLATAPDGDIFVAEPGIGRIT